MKASLKIQDLHCISKHLSLVIFTEWLITLVAERIVAEHLSARLLIVQRSQFAFVRMYVYPSHFNCMGAVSVVSSPDY